jgi:hypothetical protein
VRKNNERRAGGPGLQILCDPGELIIPQLAEPSFGADIDRPYEMSPSVVEALPAAAERILPIALSILLTVVSHDVVLAGGTEGLAGSGLAQDLVHGVELVGLGVMARSPGCRMNSGARSSALIFSTARSNVPIPSRLAGRLNPM